MRHWLRLIVFCFVFSAGALAGHLGWAPGTASAGPPPAGGAVFGGVSWTQLGNQLKVSMQDPDTAYLGVAVAHHPDAWLDPVNPLGGASYALGTFTVDLDQVSAFTLYQLVPVAAYDGNVFRPCNDPQNAASCVAPRPPPSPYPPYPGHVIGVGP